MNKLGVPNGPHLYKTRPSRLIGPRTGRPVRPCRELPSLLSERVWEPDLLDMWRSPDLAPRVKARLVAETCAPRAPHPRVPAKTVSVQGQGAGSPYLAPRAKPAGLPDKGTAPFARVP